ETIAAGRSMSGALFTCIRANEISPASIRPTNSTIGKTGLRMHQDETLRKFICLTSFVDFCRRRLARGLALRIDLLPRVQERPGRPHHALVARQPRGDPDPLAV